jgi:hypothetical protein
MVVMIALKNGYRRFTTCRRAIGEVGLLPGSVTRSPGSVFLGQDGRSGNSLSKGFDEFDETRIGHEFI